MKADSGSFDKSYISAWIDFNNNGKFDEGEMATSSVNGKNDNVVLTFSEDAVKNMDKNANYLGARVRIAANADDINQPTGQAFTGEVEDFLIPVGGASSRFC